MKKPVFLLVFIFALAALSSRSQAQEITFQDFYDALTPYGDWINVEGYGYCWRPSVSEDWAPYTDGSWLYTDSGWTWCGNEEWAWAPYHYGRWTQLQDWGWVWVPGYEWAPAWVSWRYGPDYVGWAPLPPAAVWVESAGFNSTVDVEYGIAPSFYSFCPVQYFCAHQLRPYIRPYRDNRDLIVNTKNVTRMNRVNNGSFIFSGGPNFTEVNQRVETPFRAVRLQAQNYDANQIRSGQARNRFQNDTLQVVAPAVTNATGRPQSVAADVPRQQVVRPVERFAQPASRPGGTLTPVQGAPVAVATPVPQQVSEQPYEPPTQQTVPTRPVNRPYPVHPPATATTPAPTPTGSYQPNVAPAPGGVYVTGTPVPVNTRPSRPQNPQPAESANQWPQGTHQLQPRNDQAREEREAQAAQQQAAQQQAAQEQAAQQRAAKMRAAQQAAQEAAQQRQLQQQQQQQYQPPMQQQPAQSYNPQQQQTPPPQQGGTLMRVK